MTTKLLLVRLAQVGLIALVATPLIVGVVTYRNVIGSNESARWTEHTNEVLDHIALLRSAMESIEGGYRGYALSGDDASLRLSRRSISMADREQGTLLALTADNPRQQTRLVLAADTEQRIIQRGESIALLGRPVSVPPAEMVRRAQIDPALVDFRAVARDMSAEERGLLLVRDADGERRSRRVKVDIILGSVLSLAIAFVSAWLLSRYQRRHEDSESKLKKLNRLYAMVGAINALGVRVRDRDDLFTNACRIAVEHGEFAMAWIGVIDRTELTVVPTAWAGANEKTIVAIKGVFSTSDGSLLGQTLAARAVREKAAVVVNDVKGDETLLLGTMHVEFGIRSIATLPLIVSGQVIGVLVLYAKTSEFFDSEGLQLLMELVGHVAFAVDYLEKQERLHHLAYYDALTQLANRRLFLDRLTQHMIITARRGDKLAVFLMDLERFRRFNDSLGWSTGDELLKQVAEWLAQDAGNVNLVARVDADRFAVVLPEVTHEGEVAGSLGRTIAAFVSHPFNLNNVVYRTTLKAGVAVFPDDGDDANTVFKHAEAALKRAKAKGEQYLFYSQKMSDTVIGSFGFELRLRRALENEEFVLHYQPKVDLVSGALTGAEALIRWNDPLTGLVPPGRFIPILEETRLIHDVGRWALRKAIEDHERWLKAGLPAIRIAVNVSPLQLRNQGFVAEVEEAIRIAAAPAGCLELEITESLIMENVAHSIESLLAIRAFGVSIAIDDFGTGFSSLSYLTKLPVDTLKIDRSFVHAMTTGADSLTLVSVIITLAHALKLKVIAEGVETEEQLRHLQLLHCDEIQGFLIGKPVPVEIFEARYLTGVLPARETHYGDSAAPDAA